MSLLGLDIGTTGCKAIIFSEEGSIIASSYREYPLLQPQPGWIELDAELVWLRVESAIQEAVAKAGKHDPVRALAPSTQGEAVCPVTHNGKPLANSIVTFDNRTVPQAKMLGEALGADAVYRISGQPLHPMGTVHKIAWWQQNQAEVYNRAWKFVCYGDFALLRLGVSPIMDTSMAARTMAYDLRAGGWSPDVLAVFGIDEDKLPAVAPSGTAVGTIPPQTCARLGLPQGVVAVTGGHDQPCGALGAGAVRPGRAMYAIGTVECVTPCLSGFMADLGNRGFPCYPHVTPGKYVTLGFNFGGGSILRWYRDTFASEEVVLAQQTGRDVYDLLLEGVDLTPGQLLLLPHFAGTGTPWLDPLSKGAIVGLTLGTSKSDIVKAILEGTTYEIAFNVSEMRSAGVGIEELRAIGGGAKSQKWLQIKADVLGTPLVKLDVSEAACLGAALLAGHGVGIFPDIAEVADAFATPIARFEPDSGRHEHHRRRLEVYRHLYPALRQALHEINNL
ncbi:MAG: FGGY-family carbohydrate kinase [Anaerolineae bacterium]